MKKKILLVDDTATVTALEKVVLGPLYDYIEARDGNEAFARAREQHPDLILMDLNMPVANGLDGLRSLKGDPATREIPVIIVTTQGNEAAVAVCRSLGAAEFLTKPIERTLLKDTVRRHLSSSGELGA